MPRYDDRDSRDGRGSTTRLYVGHLSSRTMARDLDDIFSRYGRSLGFFAHLGGLCREVALVRVRDVDMKRDYAFVEFSDPRDADDARYKLDGREVDGSRIIVEFAKGVPRGAGGSREISRDYHGRGPPPGTGRCFNCGLDGHWARDCKAGDWKNKCYRCGERGHIEKKCTNSPRATKRGRSYSRSPSPPRRGRGRSRSYSRSPSFSRSRSPVRRERSRDRDHKRSRSPKRTRRASPSPPPRSKGRRHSWNSDDRSPSREKGTPSPRKDKDEANGSENSGSPKDIVKDASPLEENGRSRSPLSPVTRESRSPVDDREDGSPRGSDSE